MQNTKFYREILGLGSEWAVTKVETDHGHSKVDVFLDYRRSTAPSPETGELCPIYDRQAERTWRHLNTLEYQTYLHARVPRVRLPSGAVVMIRVPWADPHSHHTFAFEAETIAQLQVSKNQTQTARLLDLSYAQVHRIMERAVARGLAARQREIEQGTAPVVTDLSMDEKAYRHRHKYITVVSDATTGRVLDVVEGRSTEAGIAALKRAVPLHDRAAVTAVAMDMAASYRKAVCTLLPQATIVHDKFHLFQYLTRAIDDTRREEVRSQPLLKRTRFLWLKSTRNASERRLFETINTVNFRTAQAWRVRQNFREMYEYCHSIEEAIPYFLQWKDQAISTMIQPVKTIAEMFERHIEGIVSYFRHPITNARAEQLNSKIQSLIATAKGYRSAETIRTAILFYCGKLMLVPHKTQ